MRLIQAPREIPVFRKEVYLEIQQERADERAAAADGSLLATVEAELQRLGGTPGA